MKLNLKCFWGHNWSNWERPIIIHKGFSFKAPFKYVRKCLDCGKEQVKYFSLD